MKNRYCNGCNKWIADNLFSVEQLVEDTLQSVCCDCEMAKQTVASTQDTDYSSDEVLERRIEAHRRMRRERQQLAERLYLKLADANLRHQENGTEVHGPRNWKWLAGQAVAGADALLAALDGQQEQQPLGHEPYPTAFKESKMPLTNQGIFTQLRGNSEGI